MVARVVRSVVFASVVGFLSIGPVEVPRSAENSSTVEVEPGDANVCTGAIDVPVRLTLSASESEIAPGAEVNVRVEIAAEADFEAFGLTLSPEGPVELLDESFFDMGPLASGESWTLDVPVRFSDAGAAAVHVGLLADRTGGERYERNEGLYALVDDQRSRAGMGGFLSLTLRGIEDDYEAGLLSEAEAQDACAELLVIEGESNQIAQPFVPLTPEQQALPSGLEPRADEETPQEPEVFAAGAGNITVQGTVSWLDENGVSHPVFGMTVQVRDDELIGSDLVAQAATGVNGQYFFVVDNDDGFGAGDRDIFVRFRTTNSAVAIENAGIFGNPYESNTSVQDEVPDGTIITENFTCANTGTGPSCGLLTGASYVASYAASLNGDTFLSHIVLEWPGSTGSANYDGSDINLRPGDRWDWDVMFHEYGHYVMDEFNFENNPGGPHNLGDCISDVQNSKSKGVRLAWGEGWPTFFGTAGQQIFNLSSLNVPRVGDVSYADTGESNFSYSLEAQDNLGLGEDNEIAVQRILWDLFDAPADGRDTVNRSDQSLFNTVNAADPTTLSGAWAAIRSPLSNADDIAFGAITTDHAVGPSLNSPAANSVVGPGANYNWNRLVGCSNTFDGDDFDHVFYNAATSAKLLTVSGIGGTTNSLSQGEYDGLVASTHFLRWGVEGSNTSSPGTGPYLGETFPVTLNRPPVANAGPDQLAECTSPSGAVIAFNGNGSSDPDNDGLSFLWTSPGIVFSNPASATPTATCPLGSKTVTLTVEDPVDSDQDQLNVEVEDTTPPALVCPADLVAECTAIGGTPAADPVVDAFLDAATAPDVCDLDPDLINNAPGFFPLGQTQVTFTATDAHMNSAQCMAEVDVVDTTPPDIVCPGDIVVECSAFGGTPATNPQIAAFLDAVTATDICDATPSLSDDAPGFFGLGATPVTFTATDDSGNASDCVATVTVVDTTPPDIAVSLSPDMLWPPNHKMKDISATVVITDICDPNPTFGLTSIVSDEPDNGPGDGNTTNDIQGASFDTPDVDFQLRAERAGPGDGREYTALYTGMDMSGNSAQDDAVVTVPHDQ